MLSVSYPSLELVAVVRILSLILPRENAGAVKKHSIHHQHQARLYMADIVDVETRSRFMSGIKGVNTKPEMQVRQLLHQAGFRYRLHNRRLPGTPDIWLPRWKAVIEVNGCFWHGHMCHLFKWPRSREAFWRKKIEENQRRDQAHLHEWTELGIKSLTIWECALKGKKRHDKERLIKVISWWLYESDCNGVISGGEEMRLINMV